MSGVSSGTVRLSSDAQRVVEEHSFSRIDVEVGGFLLGRIQGNDTEIVSAKPALTAESAAAAQARILESAAEVSRGVELAPGPSGRSRCGREEDEMFHGMPIRAWD
jgi:hypothetical protein